MGQRPERQGVATQTTYRSLTKRRAHFCTRFGAFRPYLLSCDPARFLLFFDTLASQQLPDPAPGNDFCCVMVCMVGVSTALTDKTGLGYPVVLVNVAAGAAFLRRMKRRYFDYQLALAAMATAFWWAASTLFVPCVRLFLKWMQKWPSKLLLLMVVVPWGMPFIDAA